MKLVTSAEMRAIDRETIDRCGISGPELMENAGNGIAEFILNLLIDKPKQTSCAVICGKGNNGGDGFVVARRLSKSGVNVSVYFMGPVDKLSPDARLNHDRLKECKIKPNPVTSIDDLPEELECDYVIDAVLGTGFAGVPEGLAAELIEYINGQETEIISIDLPSGLNADTGQYEGAVVIANHTFTLALPKYGLYVTPGRETAGFVVVVPIGIPDTAIEKFNLRTELTMPWDLAGLLPERKPDGHKGDFGKLLLVAGSTGLTGAAALASRSAIRSGCGLVKLACPATTQPVLAIKLTEATTIPLPDVGKKGALALRSLGEIRKLAAEHDALVIGPGLGLHHETLELVRRLVASLDKPAVLDADGVTAFTNNADLIKNRPHDAGLVLTPHPGEFARLTGKVVPVDIHERIALARETAHDLNVVLVLKGSPTLVASPDLRCWLNPTGNSGMATGGSGDVLSGVIGSFLAQGMSALHAAICGVYVHGTAGDIAADLFTQRGMIAGDIVECLPKAFERV
ncbi:MAG: NAD(P)H-hydrate dehydratase [Candidatus Zixiibacteriota bacterium]